MIDPDNLPHAPLWAAVTQVRTRWGSLWRRELHAEKVEPISNVSVVQGAVVAFIEALMEDDEKMVRLYVRCLHAGTPADVARAALVEAMREDR